MKRLTAIILALACAFLHASALSEGAAAVKAGAFRPVITNAALNTWRLGALNEPIFAFSNGGIWDSISQRMLYIGAPHGCSMRFAAFTESNNTWQTYPMPPGNWGGAHSYDHQTVDTSGHYYHLYWTNGVAYRFNTRTNLWDSLPATTSGFGTLDYFKEANGLLRVVNGTVNFYSYTTSSWRSIRTGLAMGGLHNIAHYSFSEKSVFFGGGDGSRAFYRIDSALNITTLNPLPFDLGVNTGHMTADPVTGTIIVMKPDSLYAYDAETDRWAGVVKNPVSMLDAGHMSIIAVNTYGVMAILSTSAWPVLLFKYAEPVAVEKGPASAANTIPLQASPNPFREQVRLSSGRGVMEISVFNTAGKRVFQAFSGDVVWKTDRMPAGVYLVRAKSASGVVARKIILQR
jgi:hypothetical protein